MPTGECQRSKRRARPRATPTFATVTGGVIDPATVAGRSNAD
jgi:hypothetical protein